MSGWLSSFLLGRPGYELAFTLNPAAMEIGESQLVARHRTLGGQLVKRVFSAPIPSIKINSNYFPLADRNRFLSLLSVTDTMLSFQTRDSDWQVLNEQNFSTSQSFCALQQTAISRLSAALVALGKPSVLTINSVTLNPDGSGTDYFAGGSYADTTYTVTLGTPLPSPGYVYITYSYKGWLVNLERIGYKAQGGWVDKFTYDFQMEGA